jgi:hypothetical protein
MGNFRIILLIRIVEIVQTPSCSSQKSTKCITIFKIWGINKDYLFVVEFKNMLFQGCENLSCFLLGCSTVRSSVKHLQVLRSDCILSAIYGSGRNAFHQNMYILLINTDLKNLVIKAKEYTCCDNDIYRFFC